MEAMVGVIGTILGTVLGWFLNSISNRGKIKLFILSWENEFRCRNEYGDTVETLAPEKVEYYSCSFALDIYNSSGEPKIMRNIHIAYNNGKTDLIKHIPKDEETRKIVACAVRYDEIMPLTIPSKSIFQIHLYDGLWHQSTEFPSLWNVEKVYLLYTDENNKEKRTLINEKSIKQCFEEYKSQLQKKTR